MKRLFAVTKDNDTMYFSNKKDAKVLRDAIKGDLSKGPDHFRYVEKKNKKH